MTRREQIVELLTTLTDALGSDTNGAGTDRPGHDSRLLEPTWLYRACSYRDLETALAEMRRQGDQQAYGGWPLRVLRHHLLLRYVQCEHHHRPCRRQGSSLLVALDAVPSRTSPTGWHSKDWQPAATSRRVPVGQPFTRDDGRLYLRLESWSKQAKRDRWEHGLDWLERNLPSRLRVPSEVTARQAA